MGNLKYSKAILDGFKYLLSNHKEVFVLGQGLWSPWYVGASMTDLDKIYGKDRIIDSPVSELGITGAGVGAAISGKRPIIVHPRIDFMLLAVDQIVNQAAKWRHMFGGKSSAPITIRGMINRGGEQGAQHSQALHSWFAHIPGLKVVMPATARDARDLLIASVLSDDPVLYIDDRWLYDVEEEEAQIDLTPLHLQGPRILKEGKDLTLVGVSYTTNLNLKAHEILTKQGYSVEVIDLRVINPLDYSVIIESVKKTGRICVVDGCWTNCGLAGEIIAGVCERIESGVLKVSPKRITLTDTPAPTSRILEEKYYIKIEDIIKYIKSQLD
jgi:pyruvate/2-oxoglutarate/acetoin dehydrogenase E1 component